MFCLQLLSSRISPSLYHSDINTSKGTSLAMACNTCSMLFLTIFILFTLVKNALACGTTLPIHHIFSAPGQVLTIDDESGARDVKAKSFTINGCDPHATIATGTEQSPTGTSLGHTNDPAGNGCVYMGVSSYKVYTSFQAIVVNTNGWTLQPTFIVDGIMAELGATSSSGSKDSVAVFGIKDRALVRPTVSLSGGSLLSSHDYIVPGWASNAMGLQIGAVTAVGAEYGQPNYQDCSAAGATACQMTVSFNEYVETFVIMFALAQKAKTLSSSSVTIQDIQIGCECRCRTSDLGTRKVTSSVPGLGNQCVQRNSDAPLTECDVFGTKWCSRDPNTYYAITGSPLPSGNYPCTSQNNYVAKYIQDFAPTSPF